MKGRLLIVTAVLAVMAAACAGDVVEPDPGASSTAADGVGEAVDDACDPDCDEEAPRAEQPVVATASETGTTTPAGGPSGSVSSAPTTVGDVSGLQPLIDQAISDLAKRLGAASAAVRLVRAELVVWPDTSLGCPQPGMEYPQVPTDGSLIVLSYDGREYRYHTGGNRYVPFLCETPAAPDKAPPPLDGYGGPDT